MSLQREQERTELNNKIDEKIDKLVEQTNQQNLNADQIGDNIISQIEQAKDLNNHMDKSKENIDKAIVYVGKIKTTKDQIVAWILSLLLLVAIIVVWACAKPIKRK